MSSFLICSTASDVCIWRSPWCSKCIRLSSNWTCPRGLFSEVIFFEGSLFTEWYKHISCYSRLKKGQHWQLSLLYHLLLCTLSTAKSNDVFFNYLWILSFLFISTILEAAIIFPQDHSELPNLWHCLFVYCLPSPDHSQKSTWSDLLKMPI